MTATSSRPACVPSLPGQVHALDTGFHRDRFDAAGLLMQQLPRATL